MIEWEIFLKFERMQYIHTIIYQISLDLYYLD